MARTNSYRKLKAENLVLAKAARDAMRSLGFSDEDIIAVGWAFVACGIVRFVRLAKEPSQL